MNRTILGAMELAVAWYPALFATGLVAGFVDAVAGGGGLLTVPILLATGLSAQTALGTNKVQSSCGTALATLHYARSGLLDFSAARTGIAATAIGAAIGTYTVAHLSADIIRPIVPVLLFGIAAYTWFRPDLGRVSRTASLDRLTFSLVLGLVLGFYDGFFGPGTGAFWALACVTVAGMDLLRATAFTKAMNLTSNLVSAAVFITLGKVAWTIAGTMACGQVIGGSLGARVAVRGGVRLIRPIFLTMVILLAGRTAWQSWFQHH